MHYFLINEKSFIETLEDDTWYETPVDKWAEARAELIVRMIVTVVLANSKLVLPKTSRERPKVAENFWEILLLELVGGTPVEIRLLI